MARIPSAVDKGQDGAGPRCVYFYGTSSSKLDVDTTEEEVDENGFIYMPPESIGEAIFYNAGANTVTIKMYACNQSSPDEYHDSAAEWVEVGSTTISSGSKGHFNIVREHRQITFTKSIASAQESGILYGSVILSKYDPRISGTPPE